MKLALGCAVVHQKSIMYLACHDVVPSMSPEALIAYGDQCGSLQDSRWQSACSERLPDQVPVSQLEAPPEFIAAGGVQIGT